MTSREQKDQGPQWIDIAGGTFEMGSDDFYPEEAPTHRVTVGPFAIRSTTVTNAEFARFVDATGYLTIAERPVDGADYPGAAPENLDPGSLVFTPTSGAVDLRYIDQWWTWTKGASWQQPEGPGSTIEQRPDHPVVQVTSRDAEAYAAWAGEELPTEAEWEFAARGGIDGRSFVWGDEARPDGKLLANFWQGNFPWENTGDDGYVGTAPVGSFPPNGFGLHDMAGNVWEITQDWYADKYSGDAEKPCCIPTNPRGAEMAESLDPSQPQINIPRKVVKGGSFLCADEYCQRYRPAARRPQMIDTGMSHIGFRTVRRDSSTAPNSEEIRT